MLISLLFRRQIHITQFQQNLVKCVEFDHVSFNENTRGSCLEGDLLEYLSMQTYSNFYLKVDSNQLASEEQLT